MRKGKKLFFYICCRQCLFVILNDVYIYIYLLLFDQCEIIKIRMITIILHRMAKKMGIFFTSIIGLKNSDKKKTPHLCADWCLKKKIHCKVMLSHPHPHMLMNFQKKQTNKQQRNCFKLFHRQWWWWLHITHYISINDFIDINL